MRDHVKRTQLLSLSANTSPKPSIFSSKFISLCRMTWASQIGGTTASESATEGSISLETSTVSAAAALASTGIAGEWIIIRRTKNARIPAPEPKWLRCVWKHQSGKCYVLERNCTCCNVATITVFTFFWGQRIWDRILAVRSEFESCCRVVKFNLWRVLPKRYICEMEKQEASGPWRRRKIVKVPTDYKMI